MKNINTDNNYLTFSRNMQLKFDEFYAENICCKLMCAVAPPHVYEAVTAVFECGGEQFTAKGKDHTCGWLERR